MRKKIIMTTSAFSALGLAHKWFLAGEAQGMTPELFNKMAEHPTLFADVRRVLEGCPTIFLNNPLNQVAKAIASALLALVTTVSVAATTVPLVAAEKFVINTKVDAKVKIVGLGENFKKNFLLKVETPFLGSELRIQRLVKNSKDKPIIDGFGGEAKAETTLTEMFALMEKQGHGQKGDLLTNGYANIFYIRDVDGVLWAVDCFWRGLGWSCRANSVEYPGEWYAGLQVISRNSVTV